MYYLMAHILDVLFTLSNKKAAFHCYIMVLLLEMAHNQHVKESFFYDLCRYFFQTHELNAIRCHIDLNNEPHCMLKNQDAPQTQTQQNNAQEIKSIRTAPYRRTV